MESFARLVFDICEKDALKLLVFSRPIGSSAKKITARLCTHKAGRLVQFEYSLEGNTVSQKNVSLVQLVDELCKIMPLYRQINLLTPLGDAEFKLSKSGGFVILGAEKLQRKLNTAVNFEKSISELDRKKQYILSGNEDFLKKLGISDETGRVHDKKRGKFRQINKFLEYVEQLYTKLPSDSEIKIFDLCCGKSYLSFAVYHYLTVNKRRSVYMLCIDLKLDVIKFCSSMAKDMGFSGMHFIAGDITKTPADTAPDMVISLHACDTATDIVLDTAARLGAGIILSTPCCHSNLASKINCPQLDFVTKHPKLKGKLCEALTDAIRLKRLSALGYEVSATELVDPEDTPKNTLLRAVKVREADPLAFEEYLALLKLLMGDGYTDYLNNL